MAAREPLATPSELAEHIGRSVGTLANWRSQGRGPDYISNGPGSPVRYRWSDVEKWLKQQTRKTA